MTPVRQWTNQDGSVVRVFQTDEPFKFRVTIDENPFNPNKMVERATKRARQ